MTTAMHQKQRLVDPQLAESEQRLDLTLRPTSLAEFVGQGALKENLAIALTAAQRRREPMEHVLLYGPPGLGKTTLAHIIAREMGVGIRITSGPALERSGDLAAILTNLGTNDIFFIDEIHRLNRTIEEILYPAMEEYALDLVIGKGPSARTLRLDLPKFTIIGATTRISLLSGPLRDRFGNIYHLNFYADDEIERILERSARLLEVPVDPVALPALAQRARRTPRIANRLLKRVRDYAQVKADGRITATVCDQALQLLGVDGRGLDAIDRRILETIAAKFNGGPVGLTTIAAATGEEVATIEEVYEPFLMQCGFLQRTSAGRVVTPRAYQHLNLTPPPRQQEQLL